MKRSFGTHILHVMGSDHTGNEVLYSALAGALSRCVHPYGGHSGGKNS